MQTLEVGYLQDLPRIWTWEDRELVQQVARARLEPQLTRLWVQCSDHMATLPFMVIGWFVPVLYSFEFTHFEFAPWLKLTLIMVTNLIVNES